MTWMGDGERPEESNITEIQKFALGKMAEHLARLASNMSNEPIDPKVEAHLRMAEDCLREQILLDKFYPWDDETEAEKPNPEYLLLDNKKDETLPSADELESWFKETENDNGEQQ